jgi:hypothetical protein
MRDEAQGGPPNVKDNGATCVPGSALFIRGKPSNKVIFLGNGYQLVQVRPRLEAANHRTMRSFIIIIVIVVVVVINSSSSDPFPIHCFRRQKCYPKSYDLNVQTVEVPPTTQNTV